MYSCIRCVDCFFFSSRRRHTRFDCDWSSDVCSSDLENSIAGGFGRSARPTAVPAPESGVVADRLQDPGDTLGGEDAVSHSGADDLASNGSSFLFLRFLALQHEQLCVGRQHFADGVLKLPSRLDPTPHLLDPVLGDVLDLLFPLNHKSQRPHRMAPVIGTMTGGLAAAEMRK